MDYFDRSTTRGRSEAASRFNDRHVQIKLLHKIHAIRDKQRAWMEKKNMAPERFPHFPISRPAAAAIAGLAGVRKPRPGWRVDVSYDHDADVTWSLVNHAGSFQLENHYH